MGEGALRWVLGLLLVMMGAIRGRFGATLRGHLRQRGRVVRRAAGGAVDRALLFGLGAAASVATLLYLFTPWLDAFHLSRPAWLRWSGAALFLAGNALLAWAHAALGRNWSALPEILHGQTLVTTGPYRWVRHPMYAAWLLDSVGVTLLSANAVVGAPYLASALALVALRIPMEERLLAEEFGEAYREYARRTGRLLPGSRG